MKKSSLLKSVVVIGLSLLLVVNLASVVFADDATFGWDDPTITNEAAANTSATNTSTNTTNTATTNTSVVLRLNSAELDENYIKMIVLEEERLQKAIPVDALIILSVLKTERRATLGVLAQKIQRSTSDARGVVEWLIELGMVEGIGNGSARRYMLSAKVYSITNNKAGYTRQRGWDTLQERELILAHMEKYREIDRQGVVELCRCSPNHASWLLRHQLVGMGRGAKYILTSKE